MKRIKIIAFSLFIAGLSFMSSCDEDEIMTFDNTSYAGIDFTETSKSYSFLTNPDSETIDTIEVEIVGDTTNYDRTFNVSIVDSLTTSPAGQYEVIGGTVPAGSLTGSLLVKLYKTEELDDTTYTIGFQVADSEDFTVGAVEYNQFKLSFTNDVVVPTWTYFRYFFCRYSSKQCYRIFVQTTGLTDFTRYIYYDYGYAGAQALGTVFGDYIMQWNLDHPDNHLKHDDGTMEGQDIVPIYHSAKYN